MPIVAAGEPWLSRLKQAIEEHPAPLQMGPLIPSVTPAAAAAMQHAQQDRADMQSLWWHSGMLVLLLGVVSERGCIATCHCLLGSAACIIA